MIGMIQSTSKAIPFILTSSYFLSSECANLQNAAPGYDFASSFFLQCLYQDEEGDPKHPHIGFLKGPLLLRVSSLAPHQHTAPDNHIYLRYIVIFLHHLPLPTIRTQHPKSLLGDVTLPPPFIWMAMLPHVQLCTPQHKCVDVKIIVLASQLTSSSWLKLVFSLNSSRDWKTEYTGFYYPVFYNFIVDFFEDTNNEASKRKINKLLQWWNRYD
jgi:hypothetical protein